MEKIAPDCGEMRVCPDVNVGVRGERTTNVTDGGLGFGKAPACSKPSAVGWRGKKVTCGKMPVEQSWKLAVQRDAVLFTKKTEIRQSFAKSWRDARIVASSGKLSRSRISLRQDAGMRQANRHGAVICIVLREAEWLLDNDAANGQLNKVLAMLVGEAPELAAGSGRLPGKGIYS